MTVPPTELEIALMRRALAAARDAEAAGDVPVGAVVAREDEILSTAANRTVRDQDPTGHAELLAIRAASAALGRWRLDDCTLYVTLEPCAMCAGAMVQGRVTRLVYGAKDPKAGAAGSLYDLTRDSRHNHRIDVQQGVLAEQCSAVLKAFFKALREPKDN